MSTTPAGPTRPVAATPTGPERRHAVTRFVRRHEAATRPSHDQEVPITTVTTLAGVAR